MKYYLRKSADCFASKNKFSLAEIESRLLAGEIDPSWEACEDGRRIWQAISKLTTVESPPKPEGIQYEAHNPPQDAVCYLLRDGQQHGPYTPTQIRTMWAAGQVTVDTLYWFEGLSDWFQVRKFCEPDVNSSAGTVQATLPSFGVGVFVAVIGIAVAAFFFFGYDTSVNSAAGRVHNQGLMQNRQLGCIAGMVLTVIGIGLVIVGSRREK